MKVKKNNTNGELKLIYTYKMKKGISNIEGAINVLKLLNYPQKIIESLMKPDGMATFS